MNNATAVDSASHLSHCTQQVVSCTWVRGWVVLVVFVWIDQVIVGRDQHAQLSDVTHWCIVVGGLICRLLCWVNPPLTPPQTVMCNHFKPWSAVYVCHLPTYLTLHLVHTANADKTKLPCLVCVSGVNTTADKTRQFCLVLTQFPISKFSVILNIFDTEQLQIGNSTKLGWDETKLSCLVPSCVHTADADKVMIKSDKFCNSLMLYCLNHYD